MCKKNKKTKSDPCVLSHVAAHTAWKHHCLFKDPHNKPTLSWLASWDMAATRQHLLAGLILQYGLFIQSCYMMTSAWQGSKASIHNKQFRTCRSVDAFLLAWTWSFATLTKSNMYWLIVLHYKNGEKITKQNNMSPLINQSMKSVSVSMQILGVVTNQHPVLIQKWAGTVIVYIIWYPTKPAS